MINVGLVGLGTVGSGVVKVFQTNLDRIEERVGGKIKIKRLVDKFEDRFKELNIENLKFSSDYNDILNDPEIDIVVELIGGIEPARTICLSAMKKVNTLLLQIKQFLQDIGMKIMQTAQNSKVDIYLEASVGGGIPVIQGLHDGLASNNIQAIYGIVNEYDKLYSYKNGRRKDFKNR